MMSVKFTVVLALLTLILFPAVTMADFICVAAPDGLPSRIVVTVTVTTGDAIDGLLPPTQENSGFEEGTCVVANMPFTECEFFSFQLVPLTPTSITHHFSQNDGEIFQDCGPFDNQDGLPVELIEISVE